MWLCKRKRTLVASERVRRDIFYFTEDRKWSFIIASWSESAKKYFKEPPENIPLTRPERTKIYLARSKEVIVIRWIIQNLLSCNMSTNGRSPVLM